MSDEPEDSFSQNDKIELAKALLAVRSVASAENYRAIHSILVKPTSVDSVDQAIHGLSKEDEFALMCKLMGTATHLVHLEQRPVILGDYIVADFLARFQPGYTAKGKRSADSDGLRCLVEVKSTNNNTFKISGKKLRRHRAFADQFGLPLFFAVRFLRLDDYAFWLMVEDSDRSRKSITVTSNDLVEGARRVLWDDHMYMVFPWITLHATYDTRASEDATGVTHPDYGSQVEFHVVSHPDHPLEGDGVVDNAVRYTRIDALTVSAFFEGFRPQPIAVRTEGPVTVQVMRPTVPCSIADLVYCMNRLPRDTDGRVMFDPSRILTGADTATGLITRELVDWVANELTGAVLGVIGFGDPESHLQKWHSYGGRSSEVSTGTSPVVPQ